MEKRGDSMALEAEEPGSDKTEVPRGATVSAVAPRSCRVLWRRSNARQKKGRTDGADATLGEEGDMARNRTQKRTKSGEPQEIPNNPPGRHIRPPNFLGFLVLGR